MQPSIKRSATSDDEDDLESLRLAALQSLKRQAQPPINGLTLAPTQVAPPPKLCNPKPFTGVKNLNKRGRGFHTGGRSARNGPYNNRVRNSNLISVQTIEADQSHDLLADINRNKKFTDESIPKLILPQDRYCNNVKASSENNKASEASSKFDRYNDSDNSESDSDESENDERNSETESPRKLERATSLEALMQELENELQGEAAAKKSSVEAATKVKPKKVKKLRKSKLEVSEIILAESSNEQGENEIKNVESEGDCNNKVQVLTDVGNQKMDEQQDLQQVKKSPAKSLVLPSTRRPQPRTPTENCVPHTIHNLPYINPVQQQQQAAVIPFHYGNYNVQLGHSVPFDAPMPYNYSSAPPMGGLNGMHSPPNQMFSPNNRFERAMSPLTIKTDILNTISAPLSPRSAAFVLQNREIIERRKKSPRRSYSRSPSPEFRRSLSPRYRRSNSRSPSPLVRQRHSPGRRASPPIMRRVVSPGRRPSPGSRRISPNSQPSSRRTSPNNNRYKRPSPSGRMSPKRGPISPQRNNIRNRLGQSNNKPEIIVSEPEKERKIARKRSRSISLSLSPSPERFSRKNSPVNKEEGGNISSGEVDPILEARKRKFEVNGSVPTEGIIRLKPKNSSEDGSETKETDEQNIEEESQDMAGEELNEDELLIGDDTYIDFNIKVDDLFSDEESDSENEGRFKSNRQQASSDGVTVMPFTQLLNGPNKNVKNETVSREKRTYERERDRNKDRNRSKTNPRRKNSPPIRNRRDNNNRERIRTTRRSRTPLRLHQIRDSITNKNENINKSSVNLSSVKSSSNSSSNLFKKESGIVSEKRSVKDRKRTPIVSPIIENKKIEIKIRNPSKYEVENRSSYDVANKNEEPVKEKKLNSRKVEVAATAASVDAFSNNELDNDEDLIEPEPEIIIETEEGEDEDVLNKNEDAGDLRAQLSRKRAERQNKLPKTGGVSSRLLQNALQGAVFKKSKKSKSKKKEKEAAPLDHVEASVYAAVRRTTAKTGYGGGGGVADINCSTASSKDRKVRVLHCEADQLPPFVASVDGKLPIHLRLGIPGTMDIFTDSKTHKISRKRSKNRGSFDQV